ncbi:MAG: hypothetical protein K2X81_14880, partial [Candidatus Obscuribacterales bacterium]|nr:hypothetical protein [Candidatus Obscuribacterales bacterium]
IFHLRQSNTISSAKAIVLESDKKDLALYKQALQCVRDSDSDGSKRKLRAFLGSKLSQNDPVLRLEALGQFTRVLLRDGRADEALDNADKMVTTVESPHYAAVRISDSERSSSTFLAYEYLFDAKLLKGDDYEALRVLTQLNEFSRRKHLSTAFEFRIHSLDCDYFQHIGNASKLREAASKCFKLSQYANPSFEDAFTFFQNQLRRILKGPKPNIELGEWKKFVLSWLGKVVEQSDEADKTVPALNDFCRALYKNHQQDEELDLLYKCVPLIMHGTRVSAALKRDFVGFFLGESKHFSDQTLDLKKIQTIHEYLPEFLKLPLAERDIRNLLVLEANCCSVLLVSTQKNEALSNLARLEKLVDEIRKPDSVFREFYLQELCSVWAYRIPPTISDDELDKIEGQVKVNIDAIALKNKLDKKSVDSITSLIRLLATKKRFERVLNLIEQMSPRVNSSRGVPAADKLVLFNAKLWVLLASKSKVLDKTQCESIEKESLAMLNLALSERKSEKRKDASASSQKEEGARFAAECSTCVSYTCRLLDLVVSKNESNAYLAKTKELSIRLD